MRARSIPDAGASSEEPLLRGQSGAKRVLMYRRGGYGRRCSLRQRMQHIQRSVPDIGVWEPPLGSRLKFPALRPSTLPLEPSGLLVRLCIYTYQLWYFYSASPLVESQSTAAPSRSAQFLGQGRPLRRLQIPLPADIPPADQAHPGRSRGGRKETHRSEPRGNILAGRPWEELRSHVNNPFAFAFCRL